MTLITRLTVITFVLTLFVSNAAYSWDANAEKKAHQTVTAFKKQDGKLQAFFDKAYGYAVFPSVGKGGIGLGGAHGSGVVFRTGQAVGSASLTQITIGFQVGGQIYSEIIFFENKASFDRFTGGDFELSAQASAIAVTAGASADVNYESGVAVFTMAKGGLMYEASVGGQKFSFDPKE